jgi:hypothetical protein
MWFSHCNSMRELKKSKRLVEKKMDIRLSNEARVVALVVRTSYFVLPNRLILELYNCHFLPVF